MEPFSAETGQTSSTSNAVSTFEISNLTIKPSRQDSRRVPSMQETAISRWLQFIKVEKKLQFDMMEHRRRFLLQEMTKDDEVIRKFLRANSNSPIVSWLKKMQLDKRHIQTSIEKETRKLQVVENELQMLLQHRQGARREEKPES